MSGVRPTGYVERLSRRVISGWAFDAADPVRPVVVQLMLDGRIISLAPANIPRDDLATLGIGRSDLAFDLPVPEGTPIDLTRLEIRIKGAAHSLSVAPDGGVYEGVLERIEDFTASGWAWRVASDEKVALVLRHGDEDIAEFLADEHREDLEQAGFGGGRHGYVFNFRRFSRGQINPRNISVVFKATGERLHDLRGSLALPDQVASGPARATRPRPALGAHRRLRAAQAAEAEAAPAPEPQVEPAQVSAVSDETLRAISEAMRFGKSWG